MLEEVGEKPVKDSGIDGWPWLAIVAMVAHRALKTQTYADTCTAVDGL